MTPVFIRPCAMSSKTTLNDAMKTLQVFNPCIGLATLTSILHLLPPTSITRRSHQMLSNPRQTGRPCARHNYMDKTSNLTIYAFLAVYIYIYFVQMQQPQHSVSPSGDQILRVHRFTMVHRISMHFFNPPSGRHTAGHQIPASSGPSGRLHGAWRINASR